MLLGCKTKRIPHKQRDLNLLYLKHTEKYLSTLQALHVKSKTVEKLQLIESYLQSENSATGKKGIKEAHHLMERATSYMVTSKQSAVPKVQTSDPWPVTLGVTGTLLTRAATQQINKEYNTASSQARKILQQRLKTAKQNHADSIRNAPNLRRQMLLDMAQEVKAPTQDN